MLKRIKGAIERFIVDTVAENLRANGRIRLALERFGPTPPDVRLGSPGRDTPHQSRRL